MAVNETDVPADGNTTDAVYLLTQRKEYLTERIVEQAAARDADDETTGEQIATLRAQIGRVRDGAEDKHRRATEELKCLRAELVQIEAALKALAPRVQQTVELVVDAPAPSTRTGASEAATEAPEAAGGPTNEGSEQ